MESLKLSNISQPQGASTNHGTQKVVQMANVWLKKGAGKTVNLDDRMKMSGSMK